LRFVNQQFNKKGGVWSLLIVLNFLSLHEKGLSFNTVKAEN